LHEGSNKKIQSKDNTTEVTEKYENEILTEATFVFRSKDSISNTHIRYRNKEISSYYKTYTNLNSIITNWSSFPNDTEKTFTTKIEIEYDKFKNWIKKIYSKMEILITYPKDKLIIIKTQKH